MRGNLRTRRLQTWIVASSAIGIICVGVVVAAAGIYPLYDHLLKQEEKNLLMTLEIRTIAVEEFLTRARDIAMQISSRTAAREMLENYEKGLISLPELTQSTERILLDAMVFTEEIWGVTRQDANGKTLAQVGLEIPEKFWPKNNAFAKSPTTSGPASMGRQTFLIISSPILNQAFDVIGRDLIVFRLFRLERIIYDDPEGSADTIIGTIRNGVVELVFPMKEDGREIKSLAMTTSIGKAMQLAAQKKAGFISASGGDKKYVLVYGPIKGSDWGLILQVDRKQLYAPVNKHVLATCNLIIAMLVMGTLVMILFVRPLTGKMIVRSDELEREVQSKTADLQKELQGRKRMEQWLMDSERRYRTLLEEVPDIIFILDSAGRFVYSNTQIENFLEYPVSSILEQPITNYVASEDRDLFNTLFAGRLDTIWDEEVAILDAKGSNKFARIRIKTSQVGANEPARYEGVMRDITRRKKLEEDLKASKEELLEKIKIIDNLYEHIVQTGKAKAIADHTAEVAHELRQPLAIIGGFARRMAKQIDSCEFHPDANQRDSCRIMISEVQRLERILTSLINFTRHESIQLEPADPNTIIEKLISVHEPRIQEKGIKLKVNLGAEIGELPLDADRFEQVIRNLISNSIEASPRAGEIEIETGVFVPSGKAQETGELESETYFELKIRNKGAIIPADDLHKIFSPFYTTKDYGTGIGLTLSKRILEEHKGSISAKSDENGTVFTVWLPIQTHST